MSNNAYQYWADVIMEAVNECAKIRFNLHSLLSASAIGATFNVTENFWLKSRNVNMFSDRHRIPYIMLDEVTSLLAALYHDHGDQVGCFSMEPQPNSRFQLPHRLLRT